MTLHARMTLQNVREAWRNRSTVRTLNRPGLRWAPLGTEALIQEVQRDRVYLVGWEKCFFPNELELVVEQDWNDLMELE